MCTSIAPQDRRAWRGCRRDRASWWPSRAGSAPCHRSEAGSADPNCGRRNRCDDDAQAARPSGHDSLPSSVQSTGRDRSRLSLTDQRTWRRGQGPRRLGRKKGDGSAAKQLQDIVRGLRGERQRGRGQRLPGLQRQHIGAFLVGVGQRQVVAPVFNVLIIDFMKS